MGLTAFLHWIRGDRDWYEHAPALFAGPPLEQHAAEGLCCSWMRSPGAISCAWICDQPVGHDGGHRWGYTDPINQTEHVIGWSDEDAAEANGRHAWQDRRPV